MDKYILFIIFIYIHISITKNINDIYYTLNGVVFIYTNHVCNITCEKSVILNSNTFNNNCIILYKDIYIDTIKKLIKHYFLKIKIKI
ncbi:hypothetical protein MYSEV_032 [Mythimna separata entomopoxvirus 'L']|uniref:Uncharacterized protein n=1 Tax=Mythimna separata entomopoxvirus 'L' TaxID=1293572 RepID=A0A916P1M0_9POXV|nr:hypothetical protein MYSEV_032 [Mythimna separata entomopoxvirus 'L']CCU56230.1 hypothetical protein MYSEV_032 [Mythimna separata entomopoxvirus 'L']